MEAMLVLALGTSQVFSTGLNELGKLGLHEDQSTLASVASFSPLKDFEGKLINRVHIGRKHAFATDSSDKLYGWGDNSQGQLALSADEVIATYPKVIPYFANIKIKYCDGGVSHSVAIDYDHNIYSFGSNATYQLGRTTGDATPGKVDGSNLEKDEVFDEVHTNMVTTYALTSKGNLFVWGSCDNGACPGINEQYVVIPRRLDFDFTVANFFVGIFSVFVVDTDGNVYGFGYNRYGQLCLNTTETDVNHATLIPNLKSPRNAQASQFHSLFLIDGQVYACGNAKYGQFGFSDDSIHYSPVLISGTLPNAKSIAATEKGTYILSDGALYATGSDLYGELGYGQKGTTNYGFKRISTNYDLNEITKVVAHFDYAFMYAEQEQNKGGLPVWAIVLIVVGSLCVLGAIISLVVWYIVSRKKQPRYNFISEEKNKLVFNDDQW